MNITVCFIPLGSTEGISKSSSVGRGGILQENPFDVIWTPGMALIHISFPYFLRQNLYIYILLTDPSHWAQVADLATVAFNENVKQEDLETVYKVNKDSYNIPTRVAKLVTISEPL